MVEACGDLRDLSAELSGHERRWCRRSEWDSRAAGVLAADGCGCDLDCADVSVAAGGFWLRHLELRGSRSAVWDDGGLRRTDDDGEAAQCSRDSGYGAESHVG